MAVTNQPTDDVTCPLCGNYSGRRASVEAHISRKVDADHKGKVGKMYRDELQTTSTPTSDPDDANDGRPKVEEDDMADLGAIGDDLAESDDDTNHAEDADDTDDVEDADEIEDADADDDLDDDTDDSSSRAEAAKESAKPGVGAVGTAAGASLLGGGMMLGDIDKKTLLWGAGIAAGLVVVYLLLQQSNQNQKDDENQQEQQSQKQPENPENVGGGLVSRDAGGFSTSQMHGGAD